MFDDNSTTIIIALFGFLTIFMNLGFGFITLIYSRRTATIAQVAADSSQAAVVSSQANSEKLAEVAKKVDGMTQARVDVETKLGEANTAAATQLGEANAATAHAEGKAEGVADERKGS